MNAVASPALTRERPGFIPRRPALPAVLLLIIGIGLGFELPADPWILLNVTAIASVAATLVRNRAGAASFLVAIALVSLGAALGQQELLSYPANDIGAFSSAEPRLAQLELQIGDPPRLTSDVAGGRELPPRQSAIASVQRVFTKNGWVNAAGTILVEIGHPHPLLAAGESVRVLGMLQRAEHATNPGQFDWAQHYRQERILTSIRIARTENIQILSDSGAGVLRWMQAWARDLLAMGFTSNHAADHALLRALVLGDADPSMRESQQQFQKIGAAYLLSISGMHIAVVAFCVYSICRLMMLSPRSACWTCMAIVILYGVIALPSASALRAVLLCCAIIIGVLSGRNIDKLQLLSIVAGVLLFLNPMELFSVGFDLGFICILGLILLAGPLLHWLGTPESGDQPSLIKTRGVGQRAWLLLRNWLAISLVAWVVSLPIVAYNFGQVSPWAIPSGVVLFPMMTLALVGGCTKILLTFAWPGLASLWASAALLPIVAMKDVAAALAHLPAAAVPVTQPSLGLITIYYILLITPLVPWPHKWWRRASAAFAATAVCCMVASLSFGFPTTALPRQQAGLSITFLDIGAGQTAVVQPAGMPPYLIDAGSSTISDVTRTVLGPFLSQGGDRNIGAVFLSHSDYDHISAISSALPTFGIHTVYTSHYFAHFASIDPPARTLLGELNHAGKSPHLIQRGDHLQLANDVSIDVLWPPPDCSFNCNNTGLVLRLSYAGRRVLFPADIQADAMRELLKSPEQLKADVLVAAHHGSSEVTTADFVAAANPLLIISSNGSPLTQKQQRFEQMIGRRPLFRTNRCGAITLHIESDGAMTVQTFLSSTGGS